MMIDSAGATGPVIQLAMKFRAPRNKVFQCWTEPALLKKWFFVEEGYERPSLRGIARRAGVDPALVHHYFKGKADLFTEALKLSRDPREIVVDPKEIAEAHWFGPGDKLPELPPPQSISRALIEANLPRERPARR